MLSIPNLLVTFRFLCIPIIITLLSFNTPESYRYGFIITCLAWLSDVFDGQIARMTNKVTKFGAFYDPFVDKLLVLFLLIMLGFHGHIPFWLIYLMIFRDQLVQGIRSMVNAQGVILKSEVSGKIKFSLQMLTILIAIGLQFIDISVLQDNKANIIYWVMLLSTLEAYFALLEFLIRNRVVLINWFKN